MLLILLALPLLLCLATALNPRWRYEQTLKTAHECLRGGDYEGAVTMYTDVISFAETAVALQERGRAQEALRQLRLAALDYRRAEMLAPQWDQPLLSQRWV